MFVEQWIISCKAEHTDASTRICLAKDKVPAFIWIQINHGDSNNTECSSRPFWLQVFVHIRDKQLQMATMSTSFTFELVYRDWGQNHNFITWKWKNYYWRRVHNSKIHMRSCKSTSDLVKIRHWSRKHKRNRHCENHNISKFSSDSAYDSVAYCTLRNETKPLTIQLTIW